MAEPFNAVPDDLDKFSGSLRELAGEAGTAVGYVGKWFALDNGQTGIYLQVKETIDQIHADLDGNFEQLQRLTGNSADGVAKAVRTYRTTDHDRAAQLDSMYPEPS